MLLNTSTIKAQDKYCIYRFTKFVFAILVVIEKIMYLEGVIADGAFL